MKSHSVDSQVILNFSNDLDKIIIESNINSVFFNDKLLALFDKHFNFSNAAITTYNNNHQLIDIVSYHDADILREDYRNNFFKKDVMASYITQSIKNTSCPNHMIPVRSSDVLVDNNRDYKDYFGFMGKANFSYIAVLPFEKHRIGLYRKSNEGDFTTDDLQLLDLVSIRGVQTHRL